MVVVDSLGCGGDGVVAVKIATKVSYQAVLSHAFMTKGEKKDEYDKPPFKVSDQYWEPSDEAIMAGLQNRKGFTHHEAQILGAIALGMSSMQVADRLCISKRTVEYHLGNAYDKLKVGGCRATFDKALELGWVVLEDFGKSARWFEEMMVRPIEL